VSAGDKVVVANDPRLSDARTPTTHSHDYMSTAMQHRSAGGGSATWVRVASINGGSTGGGASVTLMIAGQGAYSQSTRCWDVVSLGNRGDNNYSWEAWHFGANTSPWQYFVKQISTWVFELWARRPGFDAFVTVSVMATHNATFYMDSSTTVDPALTALSLPVNMDQVTRNSVVRVVHTGSAWPARPAYATYVEWMGPSQPPGMTQVDTWVNTSP
jgi:hypothetical protein